MSSYIEADYEQSYLFPPCLEDLVDASHPARFIREFVDSLDLKKEGFNYEPCEVGKGAKPYSPRLLLCAWLFGYMEKIRTSRSIEKACINHIGMMWLTGMHKPDHNTLWRFWSQNKEPIRGLFKKSVNIALGLGMVQFVSHALDGTKIMSVGSKQSTLNNAILTKDLKEVNEAIDEIMSEATKNEESEVGEYKLDEKLQNKKNLKATIEEKLKILEEQNIDNYHEKDTDARMMKMKSNNLEMCYNCQVVTDSAEGIIVAEKVFSDQNDQNLLNIMLDEVEKNLGKLADSTLVDSGYNTEEELYQAEELDRNVLANQRDLKAFRKSPYHKKHFKYDEKEDVFICPHTQEKLVFEREKDLRSGKTARLYRCKCSDCPLRNFCSKETRGKSIEMTKFYAASARHDQKVKKLENKNLLKTRGQIVELTFAHIKEHASFRRALFMGIKKVQTQWSLVCAIQNLKKIFKKWSKGANCFAVSN